MAPAKGDDPFLQGLFGPGGEQQHPQSLQRARLEGPRDRNLHRYRAEVVVGAGDRPAGTYVHHCGGAPGGEKSAEFDQRAQAQQRAQRNQQRAADDEEPEGNTLVHLFDVARVVPPHPFLRSLVENQAGVCGVVVGHDHQGSVGGAVAGFSDDVPGGVVWQNRVAHHVLARVNVIGNGCGGQATDKEASNP
ncbi:MAG: hypothetical protein NVSMB17_06120 [Candidatus Dormibacteria bacterium]